MHFQRIAPWAALLLLGAACEDHTEGVAEAVVEEPTESAESAPREAPDEASRETLTIDTSRSSVGFTGAKVTDSHDGTFQQWSGTIDFDPADPAASKVAITIQMDSVQIEPERLQGHLKSEDLFAVETYPEAKFESTSIVAQQGENGATHRITGDLTLHGQTKRIAFPAKVEVSDGEVAASAEFVIDRQQFGITYPGMPDDLIKDEVVIRFDVKAPRS